MGRRYNFSSNCVSGTGSATLPIANIVGATTVRPKVYDITCGFDATPADNAFKFNIQRGTTAGTLGGAGGAAITPKPLDFSDPASLITANQGVCSVGPTLTANEFLLAWAQNQRATFRWAAAPGSELLLPASATASLNLMALVATASVNCATTILYEE